MPFEADPFYDCGAGDSPQHIVVWCTVDTSLYTLLSQGDLCGSEGIASSNSADYRYRTILKRVSYGGMATALGVLASGIAIAEFVWQRKGHESPNAKLVIQVLGIFSLGAVIAIGRLWLRAERHKRIADAFETVRWTYLDLQNFASSLGQATSDEIKVQCRAVVNKASNAVGIITGRKCSVCIKLIDNNPNVATGDPVSPRALTLCRDDSSRKREMKSSSTDHWIHKNTAFHTLVKTLGTSAPDSFFCNNLVILKGYENTSIPSDWVRRKSRIPLWNTFIQYKHWPLPDYRSAVVFRIVAPPSADESARADICGFLCLDSPHTYTFRRDDLSLFASIADCLYQPVKRYSTLKSQNTTETKA